MIDDTRNNQTTGTSSDESSQSESTSQQSQPVQQPYYAFPQQATPQQQADSQPGNTFEQQATPQPESAFDQQAHQERMQQAHQAYHQAYQQYAQSAQTQSQKPKPDKQKQKQERSKKNNSAFKTFGISFAGAALAVIIGLGCFLGYQLVTDSSSSSSGTTTTIEVSGDDVTLAEAVAEKCLPSIASIDVYEYESSSSSSSFFGFEIPGQDDDATLTQTSLGSGVVISSDGYILTNDHVVEDADYIVVTVNDTEYEAELVGSDSSSDIAVLKVDATGLTAMEIGSSSDVVVGEWVMALGNPFGLENSVSTGVVSALQRSTTLQDESTGETVIYPNMIQTDATINPGNSGGALVNSEGELIGITSMITTTSGSSAGVGFAIPIDYAMGIAEQIMDGETPTHAQLGVSMVEITSSIAEYYGLATDTGVYVANVYADSAADEAGIKKGDIIVAFDGETVTSASDLQLAVRSKSPGDTVDVVVNRDGEEITISVTLGDDEDTLGTSDDSAESYGYGSNDTDDYGYGYGY